MGKISLERIRFSTLLLGSLSFFLVVVVLGLVLVYGFSLSSRLEAWRDKTPLPLLLIGYQGVVSFRELTENMNSVKRFYENQDFSKVGLRVDFSTDDGQKRLKVREKEVLNKMLEDEAIRIIAENRGISVSKEIAHQGVARKLEEYGSATRVKEDLERLYGWEIKDFEEKIVLPSLYEEKLVASFEKEVNPGRMAQEKIERASEALRQGDSFADVIREYSDGQTAETGGELGWFALLDLAPELRAPVSAQKVGTPGNVIESSLGFHIVEIQEVKTEKTGTLYRLKQVFARKETFASWLSKEMSTLSIFVLAPEYRLNKDDARIEFVDEKWRLFEEEFFKKATGDPTFMF